MTTRTLPQTLDLKINTTLPEAATKEVLISLRSSHAIKTLNCL